MVKWYEKYLQVYGCRYDALAFAKRVEEIRIRLQKLQSGIPLVTVSVIAYNEERHLLACLWALSEMVTRYPVEIIGVDNDSTDRTAEIFRDVGIPFYTEHRHSCGYARLCGLSHARGKYHVNIDADTLYPSHYVDRVICALESSPQAVGLCATWGYFPDENHSPWGLWLYESFRNLYLRLQSWQRPELSVRGLVFTYRTELARRVGIRTDIKRGEDGMLAWGLRSYGKIIFLRTSSVRAVTGYGTMGMSLGKRFWQRVAQVLCKLHELFIPAKEYKDRDYNLIAPEQEK